MTSSGCNIVIMGVSYFDGMAGSTRVRNIFEPLVRKNLIKAANLIYQTDNKVLVEKEGKLNGLNFRVIGFRLGNIFSIFSFWSSGISFLRNNRKCVFRLIIIFSVC